MFTETISKNTRENLASLGKSGLLKNAYLAGGTALALQLGHRLSYDLDFFTPKQFKAQIFLKNISKIKAYKHRRVDIGTILGELGDVKFSLFYYPYPLLEKPVFFENIKIANLADIAAMKVAAISERGTRRDFIDLYFLLQKFILPEILQCYDKRYGTLASNQVHIRKSLVYFDDAEKENMPEMLKRISWREVKDSFQKEVKKLKL